MPTTPNIAVTVDCIELIPNIYKPNVHSRGNDLIFQLDKEASSLLFQGIKTFFALLLSRDMWTFSFCPTIYLTGKNFKETFIIDLLRPWSKKHESFYQVQPAT